MKDMLRNGMGLWLFGLAIMKRGVRSWNCPIYKKDGPGRFQGRVGFSREEPLIIDGAISVAIVAALFGMFVIFCAAEELYA